jgi:hypothetical protein
MNARKLVLVCGLSLAAIWFVGYPQYQRRNLPGKAEVQAIEAAQKVIDDHRIDCAVERITPIDDRVFVIACTDAQKFSFNSVDRTLTKIY